MQTFLITGIDSNGYGACSPCHKGVLLGFGHAAEPMPCTASWHLGLSRIGDTRYYATVNQTTSDIPSSSTRSPRRSISKPRQAFSEPLVERTSLHYPRHKHRVVCLPQMAHSLSYNRSRDGTRHPPLGPGTHRGAQTQGFLCSSHPMALSLRPPPFCPIHQSSIRYADVLPPAKADPRQSTTGAPTANHGLQPRQGVQLCLWMAVQAVVITFLSKYMMSNYTSQPAMSLK